MRSMTKAYEVPVFYKSDSRSRPQITALADLPNIMLQAHSEMLAERPEGTPDNGEFGLVKASIEGSTITLVFWLELPDAD